MLRDEIIEMAIQANLFKDYGEGQGSWLANDKNLEAFAKLVAAKEREACALIAEKRSEPGTAAFIRARGEA